MLENLKKNWYQRIIDRCLAPTRRRISRLPDHCRQHGAIFYVTQTAACTTRLAFSCCMDDPLYPHGNLFLSDRALWFPGRQDERPDALYLTTGCQFPVVHFVFWHGVVFLLVFMVVSVMGLDPCNHSFLPKKFHPGQRGFLCLIYSGWLLPDISISALLS